MMSRLIISVTIGLVFMANDPAVATDVAPVPPVNPLQDDTPLPTYQPPKKLVPRARVGGTFRGTDGTDPEIVALVPDHIGLTVRQTPTLNWYLSKATAYPLRFTLSNAEKIIPVYEGPLPTPKEAGVQSIDLKSLGITLEPNVEYRWYVSARRNTDSYSEDIVAGGMIERCEFAECLTITSPNLTCDKESVRANALIGLWYDAMSCVCTLIEKDLTDPSLRRLRASLLRQVGLNRVADWDLSFIQTHAK
jgi:Domain of Unknown Function (DUF928)